MKFKKIVLFILVIVGVYILFGKNKPPKSKVASAPVLEIKKQVQSNLTKRKPSSVVKNKSADNKQNKSQYAETNTIHFDDQLVDGYRVFLIGPEQVERLTDKEFQELRGDWQVSSAIDTLTISFGKHDPRSISYSFSGKQQGTMGVGGEIGKSDKGLVLRLVDGTIYYVVTSRSETQMEVEMYKKSNSDGPFEYVRDFTLTKK